jgi:hypothetical protein
MAPENEAALEAQEEVLADRFDTLEPSSVELLGDTGRRSPRVRALHLHRLADEHLEASRGAVEGISLGHASIVTEGRLHPALAGAVAAAVWAGFEPLDRRLFRCDYSDVAVLGKLFTSGRLARPVGLAIHLANGAAFGLVYAQARQRLPAPKRGLALTMALAEHVALYPLTYFVDRHHPARGEDGVPALLTNRRAFAQATLRHALFGALLGRLSRPR